MKATLKKILFDEKSLRKMMEEKGWSIVDKGEKWELSCPHKDDAYFDFFFGEYIWG